MVRTTDQVLIKGGTLLTPHEVVEAGCVLIEKGKIVAVGPETTLWPTEEAQVIDARGMIITPGFIDIHVHGGMGHDTMDATSEALEGMARFFVSHGVTSFLPATITGPRDKILAAIETVNRWSGAKDGAEALGLHLEGPYISVEKRGAQPAQYIRPAEPTEYELFFKRGSIRLITLAPEIPENRGLITYAPKRELRWPWDTQRLLMRR